MTIENVGPGGVSNSYGQRSVNQPAGISDAGIKKPYYKEYGKLPGGDGAGVTDGDKGDVIVSGTGTVWTLDPATYNEDLGTILAQVGSSATEVSAGAIVVPAGAWTLGRELIISGKAVGTGATAKTIRARVSTLAGSVACSTTFTSNTGSFELKLCRTAGTDAAATLDGAGSASSAQVTGVNVSTSLGIVLSIQAAAAESLTITWAKAILR